MSLGLESVGLPPSDPLFTSAWLKWGQGVAHTQALEAQVDAFCEAAHREPIATFATQYHAHRHGFSLFVDSILTPIPVTWGLILGDCIHGFHAALDHVAWAVVTRGRTPPEKLTKPRKRNIYFPIFDKPTEFNATISKTLPGARRADIAIIRSYQPYRNRPYRNSVSHLALLRSLSNTDKHRTITPVWDMPESVSYEVTYQRDCVLTARNRLTKVRTLQIGTELALIPVKRTGAEPQIEVKPDVTARPALEEQRVWLDVFIYGLRSTVCDLLLKFAGPPEEIRQLSIDWDRMA